MTGRNRIYHWHLFRGSAWNRGFAAGVKAATKLDDQKRHWLARLQKFYYAHINRCQKEGCEICKELNR